MTRIKHIKTFVFTIAAFSFLIPVHTDHAAAQSRTVQEIKHNPIIHTVTVHQNKKQIPQKPLEFTSSNVVYCDLTKPSGLTVSEANDLLKGTALEGLGSAYVEAEHKYKVNALYLIAHSGLESGWGTSPLARNKNNLFGVTAFDNNPYQDATTFYSKSECILSTAKLVSQKYLSSNGVYHNGRSLESMSYHYATDKSWAYKIGEIMVECQYKVNSVRVEEKIQEQKRQQMFLVNREIKLHKLLV